MAAEIIQLSVNEVEETGTLNLNEQIQDAELSVQISFIELEIKHLNYVMASIKSITSSCGTGVKPRPKVIPQMIIYSFLGQTKISFCLF